MKIAYFEKRGLTLIVVTIAMLCFFALSPAYSFAVVTDEEDTISAMPPGIQAFPVGETLTYDISWSKMISAGTVTLTVGQEKLEDGRTVLKFLVRGRSVGALERLFPVNDTVESVFDPRLMQSLSYRLSESFGKRQRLRVVTFDTAAKTAVSRLNEDPVETLAVPGRVQDGLSSFYYLRTWDDFVVGKHLDIAVVDSGKDWNVEITVLGRETITTPAGVFSTIKVKTYPTQHGVFLNKGVVFIWLTDDARKIPVLMKSTLTFGSFVFMLMEIKPGYPPR